MNVSYDYSDTTVVVTGGSSGIGRAVARRFGAAGATVINADVRRDPKDIAEEQPTDELVDDVGGRGVYVETDVADVAAIEAVVEAAHEYGGVDVMVNNAAIFVSGNILDLDPADFDRLHAVNAKGVFYGTQVAALDMIDRGVGGCILNTASISADLAQFDHVQYDSTKGAVKMITRGAALELADHGVRVNAVAPGHVATEISEGWTESASEEVQSGEVIKHVPLGRAATPEDVAGAYLFLASDDARYVTGETLWVDGGLQVF
ncbi:glucose 1-dehydrogenase [Salinigranum marinum]|uniref:SDR family NAD(P)-dependent oxidoreductase n=1 Tax=Salinigranum marinum TaxID=1515595 RepID=UPI002989AF9E|nr:glucose 1-dehydrogenase [Salinigranum marinum]